MVSEAARSDVDGWKVVDALYPSLHRFAGVVAPWDPDPDDLLHDALVATLERSSWSNLDHPEAYLRQVMVNMAAGYSRRQGIRKRRPQDGNRSLTGRRLLPRRANASCIDRGRQGAARPRPARARRTTWPRPVR